MRKRTLSLVERARGGQRDSMTHGLHGRQPLAPHVLALYLLGVRPDGHDGATPDDRHVPVRVRTRAVDFEVDRVRLRNVDDVARTGPRYRSRIVQHVFLVLGAIVHEFVEAAVCGARSGFQRETVHAACAPNWVRACIGGRSPRAAQHCVPGLPLLRSRSVTTLWLR